MELHIYDGSEINAITKKRAGESRIGEHVKTLKNKNPQVLKTSLADSPCRYVLMGIPEDIGVRANFGRAGAYSAWQPSLHTILNAQSNYFLTGDEILILGHVDFTEEMSRFKDVDFHDPFQLKSARETVSEIDEFIAPIIQAIIETDKEPIIIGGGHNNAYPNISGAATGLKNCGKSAEAKINSINCDAHSDLRPKEGRHSGNGFTYAFADGYLEKYAMIALHEIFNTNPVLEMIRKESRMDVSFYEDIFVKEKYTFRQAVQKGIDFISGNYCGLELDMDIIQNIPSSAKTSSGISPLQARQYVHEVASQCKVAYFHIAEAAPVLSHIKTDLKTGKLMAYLVTDYIKARNTWQSQHS